MTQRNAEVALAKLFKSLAFSGLAPHLQSVKLEERVVQGKAVVSARGAVKFEVFAETESDIIPSEQHPNSGKMPMKAVKEIESVGGK